MILSWSFICILLYNEAGGQTEIWKPHLYLPLCKWVPSPRCWLGFLIIAHAKEHVECLPVRSHIWRASYTYNASQWSITLIPCWKRPHICHSQKLSVMSSGLHLSPNHTPTWKIQFRIVWQTLYNFFLCNILVQSNAVKSIAHHIKCLHNICAFTHIYMCVCVHIYTHAQTHLFIHSFKWDSDIHIM